MHEIGPPTGRHCILELYGCDPDRLNDPEFARTALQEASRRAGTTLLREVIHAFEPEGITALALLAESHVSIHTWPEHGFAAIDFFTCGEQTNPEAACRYLAEVFAPESHTLQTLHRGFPAPPPGAPRRRPAPPTAFAHLEDGDTWW
ncbi:MAG: adenosylmethionine decarboxylase [Armatimonadota bacterium]